MSILSRTLAMLVALFAVQAPATKPLTADERAQFEQWWDAQPKITLPFENDGAKVLLVEFTDLQCPFCRQKYIEITPIVEKYAANPKDLKFILKHWPINTGCNAGVSRTLHPSACDAAAAAVMARPKKTADKLIDWFFMHQDAMTPASVRQAAAEVGKITDFDAQYARAIQEVRTDAALGSSLRVDSTPSFFVNGRRVPGGGLPPQYFEALLDLEIKRAR
jgi:protein-disulfide isomerase